MGIVSRRLLVLAGRTLAAVVVLLICLSWVELMLDDAGEVV